MRTRLIFKRGGFKMSTIFCVSGRLKMATIHGGRSKIATICKGEGKRRKVKNNQSSTCYCRILLSPVPSKSNEGSMPKITSPRWMEPITIKVNYVLLGGLEINRKMWLSSDADVNFHKSRPKGDRVCFALKLFISTHGSSKHKDFP